METTTPVNAPAAATETSPALAATTTTEPLAGDEGKEAPLSLEEARKIRSESTNLRKRLKSYEDKEAEAQAAALSESQKLEKRATQAEKQVQVFKQQLITAHVKIAAQAKGIIDPEMAALAIQGSLEFGEDGMPTNIEKALDDLVKSKTYLLNKEAAQASTAQPHTPAIPVNNPGRRAIQSPAGKPGRLPTLEEAFGRRT